MEGFPGFVAADARSVNSRARARFDETPPATAARSAGSSFASPRSSSCSTVRREPERERRLDACERRLEDKERELVRERERLAEAFRPEARASKNAKDAERRAEKAHAQADRLRRETSSRRSKRDVFLKRSASRQRREPWRRLGRRDARTRRRATKTKTKRKSDSRRDWRRRPRRVRRFASSSDSRGARVGDARRDGPADESRRVAARLLGETALRDVQDTTVPSLRRSSRWTRRRARARRVFRGVRGASFRGGVASGGVALYKRGKQKAALRDPGPEGLYPRVLPRPARGARMDDERAAPAVWRRTHLVVARRERRGEDAGCAAGLLVRPRGGPAASQAEVYEACGPLIRCVADGYDVCLLAYGQTGSGKTHTMSGPPRGKRTFLWKTDEDAESSPSGLESLGVNYRALDDVFRVVRAREPVAEHVVTVSVLEIYNEECRDLLAQRGGTKIDVAGFGATNAGRTRETAPPPTTSRTPSRASRAARMTSSRRCARASEPIHRRDGDERSSRSHSVVIVRVGAVSRETRARTRGALYLVDLAGSERVARSEASGDRLKEARHINKSLSALGDVVAALQEKRAHVPYRNSKLTTLLRGALGPNGKAALFAHVSPAPASADESVSTLAFAERAAAVELGNPNETSKPKKPKKPKPSPRRARRARGLGATWRRCARASRRRNKERETPSESFSGASGASGFSTRHHALPPARRTDPRRGSRRSRFPRRTRAGNLGGKSRLQTIFADSRRARRTKTRRTSTRPFRTTRFRPTACRTKTKTRKSPATRGSATRLSCAGKPRRRRCPPPRPRRRD